MIQPEEVKRNEHGFWFHSQYPEWDEGTTMEQVEAWENENNIRIAVLDMESDAPEEVAQDYFESDSNSCTDWNPVHPAPGAFLLSIHDAEDGPVAIFAVPLEDQEKRSRCA